MRYPACFGVLRDFKTSNGSHGYSGSLKGIAGSCSLSSQLVKQLNGNFAFILFYSKDSTLFLDRDGEGRVQLHWGTASDGSLVCTDNPNVISAACGNCYTPFPPGCIFITKSGLMSFDHPLHKVVGISQVDNHGNINAAIFQVDLFTRLHSIPRTGSATNWAGSTVFEGQ